MDNDHWPFSHAAQLLEEAGPAAGVTTTRAGKCGMSLGTARLYVTLSSHVKVVRSRLVEWDLRSCNPYARDANPTGLPAPGAKLCAEGTLQLSSERNVKLAIVVAEAARGASEWRPTSPSLREVYIERVKGSTPIDSLDVPGLGGLLDMIQTPFDQWPKVDFETEITWTPPKPVPGDIVRVTISIRNTGTRPADPALVSIVMSPCCDRRLEVRQDWLPYIAAGRSERIDYDVPLPNGMAMAIVSVKLGPSNKRVRETVRHPTAGPIGYPPSSR